MVSGFMKFFFRLSCLKDNFVGDKCQVKGIKCQYIYILLQGKKKKQFIDKKSAHSFQLVHRSQKDPLQADEESSKHVLLPVDASIQV